VTVFHDFTYSSRRIAKELDALKIGYVQIYGATKDPGKEIALFAKDERKQVCILSNAMAIGLDRLKVAKYGIFYESPVPVITRKQARRRIERQGTEHKTVFIYDLIVHDTMDERILEFHKEGGDLFRAIIEGQVRI
jgi:SNF2 family DNA or RNA helicase